MSNLVEITLDAASLARVEAYAALKRMTLNELVDLQLRSVADDFTAAALPRSAYQSHLLMLRHQGRDTTAGYLSRAGWDEFERPMPQYLYNWTRRHPGVVIDGGANTGFYALLAANASPENRVLAFEPDPFVRELLQSNVDANRLRTRIEVCRAALSKGEGVAQLYVPSQEHGVIETSSSLEGGFKSRHAQVIQVETTSVDVVARSAAQAVTAVKLCVAGHEVVALAGTEQTIQAYRPVIFLEVSEWADVGSLSAIISRHNYIDVALRPDITPLTVTGAVVFESSAWNHAFVPAEKLPRFLHFAPDER